MKNSDKKSKKLTIDYLLSTRIAYKITATVSKTIFNQLIKIDLSEAKSDILNLKLEFLRNKFITEIAILFFNQRPEKIIDGIKNMYEQTLVIIDSAIFVLKSCLLSKNITTQATTIKMSRILKDNEIIKQKSQVSSFPNKIIKFLAYQQLLSFILRMLNIYEVIQS
ncbi:hypothetical protein TTHERM_000062687 (macronuclear) [Tetrahymena thermophila SB210]|uniref:Uncharacterized protein n=1 Tax=Tetrahymena thermophila (strain SB210) TaxID=312017 RepID=W7XLL0_TETTS|nr:hypothetical protein TTHERM_000062687 [Tetrahymena thermophila SB210]EWS76474.1 hypothetical protein TTHERM_000062687 [Tetrahymena thermophila SB210]|eukprot:XP_012650990.1 hypothetical protein TTHERM_000062687 [Tetrahymena thermophila SB210]